MYKTNMRMKAAYYPLGSTSMMPIFCSCCRMLREMAPLLLQKCGVVSHSSGAHRRSSGNHPHQCPASDRSSSQWRLSTHKHQIYIIRSLELILEKGTLHWHDRSMIITPYQHGCSTSQGHREGLLEPCSLHDVNPLRELHLYENRQVLYIMPIMTTNKTKLPPKENQFKPQDLCLFKHCLNRKQ